jgi:hypothetical protein
MGGGTSVKTDISSQIESSPGMVGRYSSVAEEGGNEVRDGTSSRKSESSNSEKTVLSAMAALKRMIASIDNLQANC